MHRQRMRMFSSAAWKRNAPALISAPLIVAAAIPHARDFAVGTGRDAVRVLVRSLLGLGLDAPATQERSAAASALDRRLIETDDAVYLNDLLDLPQPTNLRRATYAMENAQREHGRRNLVARLVGRLARGQSRLWFIPA